MYICIVAFDVDRLGAIDLKQDFCKSGIGDLAARMEGFLHPLHGERGPWAEMRFLALPVALPYARMLRANGMLVPEAIPHTHVWDAIDAARSTQRPDAFVAVALPRSAAEALAISLNVPRTLSRPGIFREGLSEMIILFSGEPGKVIYD